MTLKRKNQPGSYTVNDAGARQRAKRLSGTWERKAGGLQSSIFSCIADLQHISQGTSTEIQACKVI